MNKTMLKCGCAAHAEKTMPDGSRVPSCIVHDCTEPMPLLDLTGRMARCHCGNVQPSSLDLAFFEYHGPGSRVATTMCQCGYYQIAHEPRWQATIEVDQKWFKHPRTKQVFKTEFHAPRGQEQIQAQAELANWTERIGGPNDIGKNEIYGAELKSVTEVPSHIKCKNFQPVGPQEDKFYCGCDGWN